MRILASFFIITIFPFFMSEDEAPKPKFEIDTEYCNSRYHFCLEYSDSLLPNKLISDNNDGVILKSKDESIVMTVAGSRRVLDRDTESLYRDFVEKNMMADIDSRIIYEIVERDFYEVSFISGKNYYFQKLYHRGNKYIIHQIVVPSDKSFLMNKVKENMDISLKM